MKIEQQATEYRPIVITLESPEEARAFVQLIDSLSSNRDISGNKQWLLTKISNAFSNDLVLP